MSKASESKGMESAWSAGFAPFSRLPTEIRQEIWSIAASSPTSTPGVCIYTGTYDEEWQEPRLVVHEPHNQALLSTNTEAHDMVLVSATPTRAYDPDRDTLFVADEAFRAFMYSKCGGGGPSWVSQIRHLAFGLSKARETATIAIAMARLTSLESLSVVYPSPSGTFNRCAAAVHPVKGAPLRRLTVDELMALTVMTYEFEDIWPSGSPVFWRKRGSDHLRMLDEELEHICDPFGNPISPFRNFEPGRPRIKYQGRCFQPLPVREKLGRRNPNAMQ